MNWIKRIGHGKIWGNEGGLSDLKWGVEGGKGAIRRGGQGWSDIGRALDLQQEWQAGLR